MSDGPRRNARLRLLAAALTATAVIVGPTAVPHAADRPTVAGRNGAVSAGHPLTSAAAFEVLLKGGNAFDAGVARESGDSGDMFEKRGVTPAR